MIPASAASAAAIAATNIDIGMYYTFLGNYQEAVVCCQKALTGFGELGNRHGVAHALDSLGSAHQGLGQNARAIACFQQSLEAFRSYGDRFSEAEALTHIGDIHHATGKPPAVRDAWQIALSILSELQHPDLSLIQVKLKDLASPRPSSQAPEPPDRTLPEQAGRRQRPPAPGVDPPHPHHDAH